MSESHTAQVPTVPDPHPTILTLAEGALYALPNAFELDGRPVTTHPSDARGFAPVNSFVYVSEGEAMIIDTGFGIHEASVLEQLGSLIDPEASVSIVVLRSSQYCSISNCRAISENFKVDHLIMGGGILPTDIHEWLYYRPGNVEWRQSSADSKLAKAEGWTPMGAQYIPAPGGRRLELLRIELQLLSTYWLYDADTRTLFTSDAFSHVWRPTEEGPWSVTAADDAPSVEQLCDFLVGSHYWWLAGARTSSIRENLTEIREAHDIAQIAPATGCVLIGSDVVTRHFELMDEALERLSHWEPIDSDSEERS